MTSCTSTAALWATRLVGVIVVAVAFAAALAWGPGEHVVVAVAAAGVVLAVYALSLRRILGADRGRGDRLIAEAALVGLAAFVLAVGLLVLTFEST